MLTAEITALINWKSSFRKFIFASLFKQFFRLIMQVQPQTNLRGVNSTELFRQKVNKAEDKSKTPKVSVKELKRIHDCARVCVCVFLHHLQSTAACMQLKKDWKREPINFCVTEENLETFISSKKSQNSQNNKEKLLLHRMAELNKTAAHVNQWRSPQWI